MSLIDLTRWRELELDFLWHQFVFVAYFVGSAYIPNELTQTWFLWLNFFMFVLCGLMRRSCVLNKQEAIKHNEKCRKIWRRSALLAAGKIKV